MISQLISDVPEERNVTKCVYDFMFVLFVIDEFCNFGQIKRSVIECREMNMSSDFILHTNRGGVSLSLKSVPGPLDHLITSVRVKLVIRLPY